MLEKTEGEGLVYKDGLEVLVSFTWKLNGNIGVSGSTY